MAWAKVRIYYETMLGSTGSTFTATSTASGDYSATYLFNMLEINSWKAANTTTPMYLTYDAGVGNTKTADYLIILGHNLNTIAATVTLQYSTDNFAADVNDAFTGEAPSADTVYMKEFTSPAAKRYWRLKITGTLSAAPYMALCLWGNKTELDYASASFDPHGQEVKANVNLSYGGYVTGIHTMYAERSLSLKFEDVGAALYDKFKTWWEVSGLKNFFIAWDRTNSPADVFLMRPEQRFENHLAIGGAYRSVSLSLKGRKE